MSEEIKYPNKRTFWKTGGTIHEGVTDIDQVTTTGQPNLVQSEDADLVYPPLPNSGLLLEGSIYSYNHSMIIVRQEHERTIYHPEETPNLFSVYRSNTEGADWIEQELVIKGDERTYNTKTYICIQEHQTQLTWNPELTLGVLWNEVQQTGEQPPQWVSVNWGQYTMGYQVFDNGKIWEVIGLSHTWIQPALSDYGAISWKYVKDW